MAIRNWGQGRLVVFWLSLLVATFFLTVGVVVLMVAIFRSAGPTVGEFLVIWGLVVALLSVPGLAVTWIWLGREDE